MKTRLAKILSIVLVLFMALSVLPQAALARVVDDNGTTVLSGWFDRWWDIFFPRPDPKPSYPAQTMSYDSHGGTSVYVDAPEGALPANTALDVALINNLSNVQAAFDAASSERGQVYAALDINFLDQGKNEVEPKAAVTVTLENDLIPMIDDFYLVHFKGGADELGSVEMEVVEDYYLSGSTVTFEADDFSVYAFVGGGSGAKMLTVYFRNADGSVINVQAVRMSQIGRTDDENNVIDPIFDPGVPSITEGQSFEGWADHNPFTEQDHGYSLDEINTHIKATYNAQSDDAELNYYAKVYNVRYVVYHDQAGAVLMTQSYHIHAGNSNESVKIDWSYVGFKGEQTFTGWITEDKIEVMGDYPLYKEDVGTVYKNGATYELSDTLQLYPYLSTGHWLTFDNNIDKNNTLNNCDDATSASYTSPVFYADDEDTAAPAKPTRSGYEFKGWFKDENCTEQFIFGSTLAEDTTVYARWMPKNTTYHVVFWVQKVTDTPDTADADKEYDFYDSRVGTALTGSTAALEAADTRFGDVNGTYGRLGYYYVLSGNTDVNQTAMVKGDGSTVLNVYYDRKVITFKYYETDETTPWTPSGSGYVPATNGDYYYYTAQDSGYYLIGTGPNADYMPSNGDTTYYYDTYSDSGTYALPTYDNFTKYHASLSSYGGSHTYNTSSNTYYVFTDHQETRIWYVDGNNYPYRPLFYQYTEQYTTGYYAVGTGPNPTAAGTHNLSGGAGNNVISGLYGAQLHSTEWPVADSGYVWTNDETISGETETYYYPLALTEYVPVQSEGAAATVEMHFYLTAKSGTEMHIYYVGQSIGGGDTDFTVPLTSGANRVGSNGANWYPNETIEGFTVSKYRFGTSGNWNNCTTSTAISLSSGSADLYVGFTRNTYKFEFYSNNETVTPDSLPAGTDLNNVPYKYPLNSFMGAVPTNGPEGCYFEGWYADPAFDTEFDFDSTMPANNIRVYAKWTMIRFRVVLDPTGGEEGVTPSDITFPGNQATTFRVDYGELVQASSINNAQREGYTLLGWFLDKDYNEPFNFSAPVINDIADMTYAEAEDEDRQGVDPWTLENGEPKPYSDVDRDNVRGKVTIYAHWRQNPDGIIGINVHYVATDKNGNTGKFSDNTTEWDDPNIYADKAKAFGQAASTPDNPDLQFLYWEILDKNGNVVGKAYPGQLWEIDANNAVIEDLTAQAVYYTFGDKKSDAAPKAEVPTREGTRASHTYRKVTTLTVGKQYLITYTNGTTANIMGNTFYGTSNRPYSVSATVSSNTITGDYDNYLFGVDSYSNNVYQFGSLSKIGYLSEDDDQFPSFTGDYDEWTLESSNGNYYLQNTNTSFNYRYISYNTNGGYFSCNNSQYRIAITFYELVEEDITGQEFEQTTELAVGNRYIIAIGDYAVGNQALNSSDNDHFIKGIRVKAQTSSVIVPTSDVDSATWEIVSGSASEGYVFKNVGNGTYLGMSSDGQCYLAATTEVLASHWTYDNGTDLNNHVTESANYNSSSRKYYYYLSFSGAFIDFTTSTGSSQGVKLYAASKSYTVTFMDGKTNTVIETQTVVEGESAVAPEAPDHTNEGYIFTGWDTDYSMVTENITVTAHYTNVSELSYTVTFRYMDSNGDWTSSSQTVQHGNAATPPTVPTPPTGYTFNSWDKKFNNITSNLTINAVYKQEATKKYTITLRAVYGRANTTYETHINWFANDDTTGTENSVVQRDERLTINQGYDIPTPDTFYNGTIDHKRGDTYTPTGLAWEDHIFLGWARIPTAGGDLNGTAHPEFNEDHLYVKWIANESEAHGGHYVLVNAEEGIAAGTTVTQVAADEMRPYHDMYAVWATVFYVYHSGTNKVERIIQTTKAGTYDLAHTTSTGCLYGGYYSDYAGKSTNFDVRSSRMGWGNVLDYDDIGGSRKIEYSEDYGSDKAAYTGANYTWDAVKESDADKSYAYTVSGFAVTPVAGATYYIKEVPADKYLQPYMHYTYTLATGEIQSAWLISDTDDANYNASGFMIVDDNYNAKLCTSLTVKVSNGNNTIRLTVPRVFGKTGATKGLLTYRQVYDKGSSLDLLTLGSDSVFQYWITLDGIFVSGNIGRTYTGSWSVNDGSKIGYTPIESGNDRLMMLTAEYAEPDPFPQN